MRRLLSMLAIGALLLAGCAQLAHAQDGGDATKNPGCQSRWCQALPQEEGGGAD